VGQHWCEAGVDHQGGYWSGHVRTAVGAKTSLAALAGEARHFQVTERGSLRGCGCGLLAAEACCARRRRCQQSCLQPSGAALLPSAW